MKSPKFYWLAFTAAAALPAVMQAGNHHSGGSSSGGTQSSSARPATGQAPGSFRSAPVRTFSGRQFVAPSQRFAPGQRYLAYRNGASSTFRAQQLARSNAAMVNRRTLGAEQLSRRNGRAGSGGEPSGARSNFAGQNHVFARHSGNWHRDWNRHTDHWWHGHRCRFIAGEWFIFDVGFVPWLWDGYPYYAYDYYYPYGSYPADGGVDAEYYGQAPYGDAEHYGQAPYGSSDQYGDSTVTTAQVELKRKGYYRGAIDGTFGSGTRSAVIRYQRNHGLRVTGTITRETLQSLGIARVASY